MARWRDAQERPDRPPPLSVVDPLTGIAALVVEAEMDPGDPDLFVVAAETADITVYGSPLKVTGSGSGAGLTYEQAYGAAVGECVERYAFSVFYPEDLHFGSYQDLRVQRLRPVAPDRWALYHPSQYDGLPFAPFDEDTRLAWVAADNLTRKQDALVPACLIYMPYMLPFREHGEVQIAPAISTGAACARSRREALLKGLCELVERDAFMIVWRNRLACPRVHIDPQSSLYALFHDAFARPGLEYALYYTTLDLGIPSFVGILTDTRNGTPATIVGGAAHPDPQAAAQKTLCELVQGLKWMDLYPDGRFPVEPGFGNVRSFDDRMKLYAFNVEMRQAFDFLFDSPLEVALSAIPSLDQGDIPGNLHRCLDRVAQEGLEVLALDITPSDVAACDFHVIKVLIPEFETMEGDHTMPFLGGRRWQEVPQRLAGLRPTLETLNPFPHPYP